MMKVLVKVYDGCKYEASSKKVAEVEYTIKGFQIVNGESLDLNGLGDLDEYDEYLVITHEDGETSTFRNSHVDMFRKF